VFAALRDGQPGETFIPRVPSARVVDVARALIGNLDVPIVFTGVRPGEKIHEIMVSEEERFRTVERNDHYVILPVLPELRQASDNEVVLQREYSSEHDTVSVEDLRKLLAGAGVEIEQFTQTR
jgi:FlaA1/EpsC-like NDP-sugar epimerase